MKLKKNALIAVIIVIVLIIGLFLFFKLGNKKTLIGTWTTDGVTVYKFEKNNKGALIVPLSTYDFTYKVDGNKLYIDFKNEKSTDSSYEYSFDGNNLVLKGIEKTTGTYTFRRHK